MIGLEPPAEAPVVEATCKNCGRDISLVDEPGLPAVWIHNHNDAWACWPDRPVGARLEEENNDGR